MLCGPLCIRFIHTQRHKRKLTLAKSKFLCRTTKDGTGAEGMLGALKSLGYSAKVKERMTWGQLRKATHSGADVIVVWWSVLNSGIPSLPDGHWSVALKVRRNELDIYDPDPEQIITLPRKFFESHWFDFETTGGTDNHRKDYLSTAIIAKWKKV